ncbi:MAG: phospholipase [Muribaculaceae bacterium]|nr:phospholipase [Muribaculaceae bacterium]
MTGALLILAVTAAIGFLLWLWERYRTARHGASLHHHAPASAPEDAGEATGVCCGLHAICEKTGQINEPPVYYDDEELDRFAGRDARDYSDAETEEFRDVLLTLAPGEAPGWALSLQKRRINLPADLKPELDLLLIEN